MVGNYTEIAKLLNSLIELDYDAIAAYRTAIVKLDNADDKSALRGFMTDHERHIVDLRPYVDRYGAQAADGTNAMVILTKGKVVIASLLGDRAILEAMKSNEEETNKRYEKACARTDLPAELMGVLAKNLADERRHRAYMVQRLGESRTLHA
jgi:uncharacterized protein (TIGR02284 family)